MVTHRVIGGGYDINDVDTVAVTVIDDDVAALVLSDSSVTVSEAGGGGRRTRLRWPCGRRTR